ncbi:MAG: sigma-70 family RNA polymerase sigma factor [Steroidobacteraceae bacterium]|jgi:RNA polymerase sigma-70 factor (ECF subfamily)|nr:sigma-70 family RNA polymerase sigma factor [Steroidobacteraceae bacterium]
MYEDSALAGAYKKMRRRIVFAIRKLVSPSDVEDVLQEAFLRCYEAEKVRHLEHPSSYLLRTAVNLAINHVGSASHRLNASLDRLDDEPGSELDLERQAIDRERLALYCEAVAQLPMQCRRAFLLKKVYGLSQREIAARLGISESTVEKHVAKGLLHCATRIADVEAGSGAKPERQRTRSRG